MNRNNYLYPIFALISAITFLLVAGCEQYDYTSPGPGYIEVRLRTKSTTIQFSGMNNYVIGIEENMLLANRSDGAYLRINQDLRAITRKMARYNVIQESARDSALILGQAYAPPGSYTGLTVAITPGMTLYLYGYQDIPVTSMVMDNTFIFPTNFSVTENDTTVITLTYDLDASLTRRADDYSYTPEFYISSIRYGRASGTAYNNLNGNSLHDEGEVNLSKWRVTLFGEEINSAMSFISRVSSFAKMNPPTYAREQEGYKRWGHMNTLLKDHVFLVGSGEISSGNNFASIHLDSH